MELDFLYVWSTSIYILFLSLEYLSVVLCSIFLQTESYLLFFLWFFSVHFTFFSVVLPFLDPFVHLLVHLITFYVAEFITSSLPSKSLVLFSISLIYCLNFCKVLLCFGFVHKIVADQFCLVPSLGWISLHSSCYQLYCWYYSKEPCFSSLVLFSSRVGDFWQTWAYLGSVGSCAHHSTLDLDAFHRELNSDIYMHTYTFISQT
jgi:hypothetical protein